MSYYFRFSSHIWTSVFHYLETRKNQYLHFFLIPSPKFLPADSDFVGQILFAEDTEENNGQQSFCRWDSELEKRRAEAKLHH